MTNPVALGFENAKISVRLVEALSRKTKLYAIFMTARSGSTWLTEMARNSGVLGTPQEWFNETFVHSDAVVLGCRPPLAAGARDADSYISKTIDDYRSEHGIMGVELSAHQTRCVAEMAQAPRRLLNCVTPFYLRRRNLVAQGISLYKSAAAGVFHSYQGGEALELLQAVPYDADSIQAWCSHLLGDEIYFDGMFQRAGVRPAQLTYEDIVIDPSAVLMWMARTIEPGLTRSITARSHVLKKLAGRTSVDWERRFRLDRSDFLAEVEQRRPPVRSDVAGACADPNPAAALSGAS